MVAIRNVFIAGLAFSAASANMQQPSTLSTVVQATPAATPAAPAPPSTPDSSSDDAEKKKKELFKDLVNAPTALGRLKRLLTENGQSLLTGDALRSMVVFDFNKNAKVAKDAKGGAAASANVDSFPILHNLGISMTFGFLNPCGINTPHVHPRATEFLTVVEGAINFGYIPENGLVAPDQNPEVAARLDKFQGTVFPMGSIHYQFNPECKPAVFAAGLSHEDPGTVQMAGGFFNLNAGVVNATLGFPKTIDGKNIEQFRKMIPANFAQDIDNCLVKCKDYKPTYY